MKKIFLLVILFAFIASANAQSRAIGARLGNTLDFSYQHNLNQNMLELNLGLPGYVYGLKLDATYNWVFPIRSWNNPGTWNWYAGVGAGLGACWRKDEGSFSIGVAGKVGVEYNFTFPLQLFVDFTPRLGPSFGKDGVDYDLIYLSSAFGIGARYRF